MICSFKPQEQDHFKRQIEQWECCGRSTYSRQFSRHASDARMRIAPGGVGGAIGSVTPIVLKWLLRWCDRSFRRQRRAVLSFTTLIQCKFSLFATVPTCGLAGLKIQSPHGGIGSSPISGTSLSVTTCDFCNAIAENARIQSKGELGETNLRFGFITACRHDGWLS